jgi:hypothetical protein
VAAAFHQNPEALPQVDHIDGNRTNNAALNLRWVSAQDNAKYGGERHDWTTQKLASAQRRVYAFRKKEFEILIAAGHSLRAVAKAFGTSHSVVLATLSRKD